ncbi:MULTISPECIES: response regulator [Haloarcula]|uniref:response regulator n=1 Tax=Haloarcula TaxID=2237 RepID=UPI000F8D33CB|nr:MULTISPECIES: response regulator [Haloarcula]NHX40259.1 response regulator [Haloarcula sp. R1-2]
MTTDRLLLVEDSDFLGTQLQDALRGYNFAVAVVSTAREAARHVAQNEVDCVVTNYDLPDETGIALARDLPGSLPVLLLTTTELKSIAAEALEAGVTDFVHKDNIVGEMNIVANRVSVVVRAGRE